MWHYLGQMTEEEHDDDDGHQSQRLPLLSALHHRPPAKGKVKEDYIIAHMHGHKEFHATRDFVLTSKHPLIRENKVGL